MTNWKTTITGILTSLFGLVAVVASVISQSPDLATFLPHQYAGPLVGICALVAAVSHAYGQTAAADKNTPTQPAQPAVAPVTDATTNTPK